MMKWFSVVVFVTCASLHPSKAQSFSEITSRSLRISWSSCSGATRYYIDYRSSSSSYWMTVEVGDVRSTQITNLVPSTTYYFRVQCANSTDRGWLSSTRNAYTPPDPAPSTPTIRSVSTTSVSATVSWSCSGATKYFIEYMRHGIGESTVVVVASSPTNIRHLTSETSYRCRVVCESEHGVRSGSAYQVFATDSLQPTILNVRSSSMSTVITWEPAARTGVEISHEVLVSDSYGSQPQTYSVAGSERRFTIDNLQPETTYSFQVRAVSSSEGKSPWSTPLTGITLPLYPGEDVNVTLNGTTASAISMSWTIIQFRVDWYMLTIQSVPAGNLSAVEVAVVNSTESYTFHDLLPLTDYTITVRAVNKAGSGPESTLNATTNTLAPQTNSSDIVATSALATLLAILILCLVSGSTFVLLLRWRKGKKTDSGSGASTQVKYSTKAENVVDMEGNAAYASVEYEQHHHHGYHEEIMSINNERALIHSLPPRIRADDEKNAILNMPVQSSQISEPVYADSDSFQKYSGWFMPSVNEVLRDKLGLENDGFIKLGSGIFYMFHNTKMTAKYVGFAANLPVALCDIINDLYKKEMSGMTSIEVELKYFSPKAENWIVQVWQCEKEVLLVERAKKIIEKQTLTPHGLNKSLKIPGKQGWEEFAEWYTHAMKTRK